MVLTSVQIIISLILSVEGMFILDAVCVFYTYADL